MFLAWRDLRSARGRFALMTGVVVLITFLVTFLAALTQGLARESVSAVADLSADHVALTPVDGSATFTGSVVTADQRDVLAAADGVERAELIAVATTRAAGDATASVTVFGVGAGSGLVPGAAAPVEGTVVLSAGAADDLAAAAGDRVTVGDKELLVADVTDVDASYSHTPVVWTSLADRPGAGHQGGDATAVALWTSGGPGLEAALATADRAAGTTTLARADALTAVGSFAAENTSLRMMQGFLYAISALVVGSFFTVWTINRSGDVAVLKALGASTGYLLRDALGQAVVVLLLGTATGAVLAGTAAALLRPAVPVGLTPATTVLPAAVLVVLGLAGAALAVRRIAAVDPHAALNAH